MIEHLHRLAAHAYYCGEHAVGRRACERLLRLQLSPEREQKVRANRTWYTRTLAGMGVDATLERIDFARRPGWSLFNPSAAVIDGTLVVNVRSSNYTIGSDGRYIIPPEDGERIRTENYLWDHEGTPSLVSATYATSDFPVEGLEDVRLNVVDGRLLASATIRNWKGYDGTCRIGYGRVAGCIHDLVCHETIPDRHEKNWMPILGHREWLYSCHERGHTCLVRDDGDDWTVEAHAEAPPVAREFRGGSQLVPIGEGRWLAVIHEVAAPAGRRVYEHRFVMFNEPEGWRITHVSPPFAFREPRTIEFCAGLAMVDRRLVASFGVNDAQAWLAWMPLDQVLGVMEDAWE